MEKFTKTFIVTDNDTAIALGSGGIEVLATPRLVAWMEDVAFSQAEDLCTEGESTVGISVQIDHLAATLVDKDVVIQGELTEQDRRRLSFHIEAFVDDKLVAKMDHQRVIINVDTFLSKLS